MSLKQTVPQQQSTDPLEPNSSSATPRSSAMQDNLCGYIPYSPYALRRRDMIMRPYSPASGQVINNLQRSYSPLCRLQTEDSCNRPYSPYGGTQSLAEAEARPYSPYCGSSRRDSSRDRWMQTQGPRCTSPFTRDYSPWRRENVDPPVIQLPPANEKNNTAVQQRISYPQTIIHPAVSHAIQINRNDAYASPIMSRKR